MAMLHTVNKSPFEKTSFDSCLRHAKPGSAVLMIEDGIYAGRKGNAVSARVADASKEISFYILGPDMKARGISEDQIVDGISIIDYDGFVDLVTEHDKVQAWL